MGSKPAFDSVVPIDRLSGTSITASHAAHPMRRSGPGTSARPARPQAFGARVLGVRCVEAVAGVGDSEGLLAAASGPLAGLWQPRPTQLSSSSHYVIRFDRMGRPAGTKGPHIRDGMHRPCVAEGQDINAAHLSHSTKSHTATTGKQWGRRGQRRGG